MRKWNGIIGALLAALFFIHAIAGAMQLAGIIAGGSKLMKGLTHLMVLLLFAHVLIGAKFTFDTLEASGRAGHFYKKENRLFLARRVSGFAVLVLMLLHAAIFTANTDGAMRLNYFGRFQLAASILFVLSVMVHILTNIKPLLISFGIAGFRVYMRDALFVLAVIFLLMALAFIIYFLRWNVFWK